MVHLELRLKIKCSKAVSDFNLSLTLKKLSYIPSSIRHHLFTSMALNLMPQILQSSYFSPLQQNSMDRNATSRSNLARRELQNPTPHQFYIFKKIDQPPRRFNPLILPKKPQASLPYYASKPKRERHQIRRGGGEG